MQFLSTLCTALAAMALVTSASMSVEYLETLMQLTKNWCINLSIQNKSFKPVLKSGLLQVVVTFQLGLTLTPQYTQSSPLSSAISTEIPVCSESPVQEVTPYHSLRRISSINYREEFGRWFKEPNWPYIDAAFTRSWSTRSCPPTFYVFNSSTPVSLQHLRNILCYS